MPRVQFIPFYNGAFFDAVDGIVRKGQPLPTRTARGMKDGVGGAEHLGHKYVRSGAFVCGADPAPTDPFDALMRCAPGEEPRESSAERIDADTAIADGVEALDERERYVIDSLYWRQTTLRELARELSLSKTHVARIRDAALAKLRVELGGTT